MTTITNHMLRQKMAEVNRALQYYNVRRAGSSQQVLEQEGTVLLSVEKIIKVKGDTLITDGNTQAKLFSPMPCLFWKCVGNPDKQGVITLQKPLPGLFIFDGNNAYCLGVSGASDEFEVRFHTGDNELRVNPLFLNIVGGIVTLNGVEQKK